MKSKGRVYQKSAKKKVVQNDIPDNEIFEDFWRINEVQKESMSKK